jgi:cytochrome c oxidase subunit 2
MSIPLSTAVDRRRRLIMAGAAAIAVGGLTSLLAKAAAPRVIKVHARKFTFTPNRIALAPNESVVFELTAQDAVMGFSIPQLGVRADVPPGTVVELPATVSSTTGNIEFLCDIFCGSGHETMNGTIVIG